MAELFLGGLVDAATHERTDDRVALDTADFTTHGVIVGMTGSGKTGLGVVLIEEVLRAGLPALLIDPKGDLTNLCLTFPDLAPADFRPWIDEAQAKAAGVSPDEFAAQQATTWRDGLAGWGYGPEQIAALRAATDFTIYTPGSQSGVPVNIVGSLQVPATDDAEVVGDEIDGYVSGLLGLVGIDADPLSSREHILLANLIQFSWSQGTSLDLPTLVGQIQQPPIRKLGVFELDQFFPAADRTKLAMKLNGLLASPAFAAWGAGQPLDIQSLLYTPDGTGRCAIVTTAHLSDEERQFVTSLVLSKLVTWMRRQSGTTDLRALLYMDEVAGYLPPTANPPTKKPIMLLMKQARAFGVGVVLSTQNPVDVDYKAISNAGTWMVGRLQTERDKQRLLDGMSAAAGTVDVGAVGDTISGLAKREFVLRRAGKDQPEVFTTRWAMSYLRGPMTRDQIARLMRGAAPAAAPRGRADAWRRRRRRRAGARPARSRAAPARGRRADPDAHAGDARGRRRRRRALGRPGGAVARRGRRRADVDDATPPRSSPASPCATTTRRPTSSTTTSTRRCCSRWRRTSTSRPRRPSTTTTATCATPRRRRSPTGSPTRRSPRRRSGASCPGTSSTTSRAAWPSRSRRTRRSSCTAGPASRPTTSPPAAGRPPATGPTPTPPSCATSTRPRCPSCSRRSTPPSDAAEVAAAQQQARQRDDLLSSAGSILGGLLGGRRSTGGLLGQLGRAAGRTGKTSAAGVPGRGGQGQGRPPRGRAAGRRGRAGRGARPRSTPAGAPRRPRSSRCRSASRRPTSR